MTEDLIAYIFVFLIMLLFVLVLLCVLYQGSKEAEEDEQ